MGRKGRKEKDAYRPPREKKRYSRFWGDAKFGLRERKVHSKGAPAESGNTNSAISDLRSGRPAAVFVGPLIQKDVSYNITAQQFLDYQKSSY